MSMAPKAFKRIGDLDNVASDTDQQQPTLSSILHRASLPPELSQEAKEHLKWVQAIGAATLKDLETVTVEIGRLKEEILLRANLISDATIRLDELQRNAGKGYATIKNALELVRKEFAAIPA